MRQTIIKAENISYYDQLCKSSFEIKEGFTTLMGPSGSGKSTCAQLLIGALGLTSGEVKHYLRDGQEALTFKPESRTGFTNWFRLETGQNRKIKKHVMQYCGYVAQTPELPGDMTVRDYIYNVRTAAGNKLDSNYVEWIVEKLGIKHHIDTRTTDQSGGEQQRTAIAFALANNPQLLIADEPNASLDSASGKEVIELTRALADQGMSVLWITHDEKHMQYADQMLFARDCLINES